jgi:hypothetical protein
LKKDISFENKKMSTLRCAYELQEQSNNTNSITAFGYNAPPSSTKESVVWKPQMSSSRCETPLRSCWTDTINVDPLKSDEAIDLTTK